MQKTPKELITAELEDLREENMSLKKKLISLEDELTGFGDSRQLTRSECGSLSSEERYKIVFQTIIKCHAHVAFHFT